MSVNFTRNDFIPNTQKAMRAVMQCIEEEAYHNSPDLPKQLLEAFKKALVEHYYQRQPQKKNAGEKQQKAEKQAEKTFGEFLQYLFHSTASPHANPHNELLKSLLVDYKNEIFLPDPDNANEINVWADLWGTGGNCLSAICGTGDETLVEATVTTAYLAFVRKSTGLKNPDLKGYRKFLSLPNKENLSPLQIACKKGCPKVVELLLARGRGAYADSPAEHEDCLTKPKGGLSPLHLAILSGSAESVTALLTEIKDVFIGRPLRLQACLEQKNGDGHTPLEVAETAVKGGSKKHENIVQLLSEALDQTKTEKEARAARESTAEKALAIAQEETKAAQAEAEKAKALAEKATKEAESLKQEQASYRQELQRIQSLVFDVAELQGRANRLEETLRSTQNELATARNELTTVRDDLAIAQQQASVPLPPPAIYPSHAALFQDAQGRVWAVAPPNAQQLQGLPGMGMGGGRS